MPFTICCTRILNAPTRTVPLNATVRVALDRLPRTGACVFAPLRSVCRFRTACRKAGLTGVTPHTLRHTFATRLIANGVDLRTVQELGGWAQIEMLERYGHVTTARKAEAVERLSTTVFTTLVNARIPDGAISA